MEKIYVLNVIGGLSKGGAEYQCSLLCDNLNSEQFESKILCFHKGPSPLNESLNNVIFISRGNKWDFCALFRKIYYVIKSEAPDIVHVWLPEIISVPAALIGKLLGIPIVASHRNSTKFSGDIVKYLRDRVRFLQYIFAFKIISNFYVNEEPFFFRFLFKQKSGEVIFNGIKEMRSTRVQEACINNEASQFLFVGRLAPEKNLPLLLRSLAILKNENHSIRLRIFGDGDPAYVHRLNELIDKLDIKNEVDFLGFNPNWHLFAPSSSCLLLPSKSEGTANVVIESLGIGLPVIISDIPMSRSILKHKINAIIVAKDDPREWAKEIINLTQNKNLADFIKMNGIEYSRQFSIQGMVSKYEKAYIQIVQKII